MRMLYGDHDRFSAGDLGGIHARRYLIVIALCLIFFESVP